MCKCNNIVAGSKDCYKQQIVITIPPNMEAYKQSRLKQGLSDTICIDPCIMDEIQYLWSLGIITYGCCCGHNYLPSFVNVDDKDIETMLRMGYVQSHPDKSRKDTYELQITKQTTMKQKLTITLEDWDHTCGDGCCYTYGVTIKVNGTELDEDGSQVGQSLKAVLEHLGYEVEIDTK